MDKILSARIDESVMEQLGLLARELNTSKKAVIEAAIRLYSKQSGLEKKMRYLKIPVVYGKGRKRLKKVLQLDICHKQYVS